MRKLILSVFLLTSLFVPLKAQPSYADGGERTLVALNGIGIGLNTTVLLYNLSVGLAGLGGTAQNFSSDANANVSQDNNRQQNYYSVFPPRIGIGLQSIAIGAGTIAVARQLNNGYNDTRLIAVGATNVALGASSILFAPLLKLIPLGRGGKKSKGSSTIDFDTGLIPSPSGTAGGGVFLAFRF